MHILKTKLAPPPLRPERVPRPRLLSRLEATLRRKLTLLSAPAGYGKTTQAATWLAQLPPGIRTAWLTVEEADNDLARFLTYLAAALAPGAADVVADALAGLQGVRPAPQAVVTPILNHLTADATPVVLILDDYHLLQEETIHTAVAFLLDHLPAHCHLLLTSRTRPPLPLARLRARHQLLEVGQAELAFTEAETAAFLNQVMGLSLETAEIAALAGRSEGWITGLQMAALSLQGQEDVAGFIQAFGDGHRYVLDYLMAEVWQRQPPQIQDFLLHTAVLQWFNAELCRAVLGQQSPSPQTILAELEAANPFLIPLDEARRWYRYHHLFADLLRQRLAQVAPEQVAVLHRRAGEWYAAHNHYPDAIRHMLAAAEMSAAAALVEAAAEETLMRSEIVTFLRWIEALPEAEVRARPLLCVYHAAALLVSGQPFAGVEKRLVDAADAAAGAADAGAVVVLRALIAVFRGEASRGAQLAEQAIAQLPSQSHFLHSLVAQSLAVAQMLHGDIHAAIASLETAVAAAEAAGNVMLHIVALCHIAELHMLGGRLLKARALYERALVEAVDRAGQPLPIAGMAHLGLGELARERNDLVTAVSTLETGIALIKRWGEIGAMDGYISLARLRQAQGQTAAAREWMAAARRIATRFDATDIDDVFVDLMLLPLMIEQGEAAAAVARWEAHRERLDAADLPFHIWEMDKLARARLALARRRPEAALTHLAEMIPRSVGLGRDGILIQARLLQARAQQQAGRPVAARQAAAQAVQLAEPGRYVRIFLDEGPLIRDLLAARRREMSEQTPLPPARQQRLRYLDELLAAFAAEAGAPQPIVAPAVDLSPRQVEVLRLIAAGMSNREIAARLMIAHSTVKTHINQIYRKLDVTSRREALQRAQTLDVL